MVARAYLLAVFGHEMSDFGFPGADVREDSPAHAVDPKEESFEVFFTAFLTVSGETDSKSLHGRTEQRSRGHQERGGVRVVGDLRDGGRPKQCGLVGVEGVIGGARKVVQHETHAEKVFGGDVFGGVTENKKTISSLQSPKFLSRMSSFFSRT